MSTEMEKVKEESLTITNEAHAMVIIDDESNAVAANLLLGIRDLLKEIASVFDPIISKSHQAHKEACSQKKKAEAPLIEAEGIINPKMGAYRVEQERKRQAEIRRQEELAQKAMEEAQLADAIEAENNGDAVEARAIVDDDLLPAPIPKVEKLVTPENIAFRTNWHFEVIDRNKIPRIYMNPDKQAIGAVVRGIKDKDKVERMIPGIRVWCEKKAGRGR